MKARDIDALITGSLVRSRKSGKVAVCEGGGYFHWRATPWTNFKIGRKKLLDIYCWCYAGTFLRALDDAARDER